MDFVKQNRRSHFGTYNYEFVNMLINAKKNNGLNIEGDCMEENLEYANSNNYQLDVDHSLHFIWDHSIHDAAETLYYKHKKGLSIE